LLCCARLEQGPTAMLCFAFAVLCARLRQELGVAVRCYALLYAVLGYGKGYVWLCKAMLCYAMLRQGLGGAVASAVAVQAYRHIHSYSYGLQP
jgi:hypothetical protein